MSDPEKASMKEVADTTESLLQALAAAHRKWILSGGGSDVDPFIDQVASHCAFQALANAFNIKELVTDPPSREKVAAFISALRITIGAEDEPAAPRSIAQA